jgi:hypothetical protein
MINQMFAIILTAILGAPTHGMGIYDKLFWHDSYIYLGKSSFGQWPGLLYLSKTPLIEEDNQITFDLYSDKRTLTNKVDIPIQHFNFTVNCKTQLAELNQVVYLDDMGKPTLIQPMLDVKPKKFSDEHLFTAICASYKAALTIASGKEYSIKETCNFVKNEPIFTLGTQKFDVAWSKDTCESFRASSIFLDLGLNDTAIQRTCISSNRNLTTGKICFVKKKEVVAAVIRRPVVKFGD